MATNVARDFLRLIDSCFPTGHLLHKSFNRNTVKASYRTMPNMGQILAKQNAKVTSRALPAEEGCNCRRGKVCPLEGKCLMEGVVYQATVEAADDNTPTEKYTGLTGSTFKERHNGHESDFKHSKNETNTTLSQHIWKLKRSEIEYTITWKIIDRGRGYNPSSKSCRLCLLEKYYIMFQPEGATLNKRSELYSHCRHKKKLLLKS